MEQVLIEVGTIEYSVICPKCGGRNSIDMKSWFDLSVDHTIWCDKCGESLLIKMVDRDIIEEQNRIEEQQRIHDARNQVTVGIITKMKKTIKSSGFKSLFSLKKSNAHLTHGIGIDKGIDYLKIHDMMGNRSESSGIDITLSNGNTIAVRASGDEPGSVFLVQGSLTNLVSTHIMIIRNINDEKSSFYILDSDTAIELSSESYYAENGTNSWFIYPKEYMVFENNIEILRG